MVRVFNKVAQSPPLLLQKLIRQGLTVPVGPAQDDALRYLHLVGGYRLKGYWFHLLNAATKRFQAGLTFADIIERYEFDRELRAILWEAIEAIELAIRCVMANYLSLKYSPHWFLDTNIFLSTNRWSCGQVIRKIEDEVGRSEGKLFVTHYKSRYDDPHLPPSWSMSECVTFAFWSRTYSILRDPSDKKAISKKFNINTIEVFGSWLHTIVVLRNMIAHHSRLLRTTLSVGPLSYKQQKINLNNQKTVFAAATVINVLLINSGVPIPLKNRLAALFAKYPRIDINELGFCANWSQGAGW
jgi:abortive infection bacteriophage resistance protein